MNAFGWLVIGLCVGWILVYAGICVVLDRWAEAEERRQQDERERLDRVMRASPPQAPGHPHRRVS